jgi:hypothetical protein
MKSAKSSTPPPPDVSAKMRAPLNPYIVLALAILAPGAGHVAIGQPYRGLGFAFFALLLAMLSWHTTTPEHSFIGRSAFGLFVWALSIPDAYKLARIRYEAWRRSA